MPRFETAVELSCTVEAAFEFLLSPANVERISPREMGLRFIDPPQRMLAGGRVEFEVTGFGPAQRLVHEVTVIEPPSRFTETQVTGPLRHWLHEHIFEPAGGDIVIVTDRIEFEPPGGLLGLVLTTRRILEHLDASFSHRHQQLKKLLEAPG